MAMGAPNSLFIGLLCVGMLIFGSLNVLDMKMQFKVCIFGLEGPGDPSACPGGGRPFNKPWMNNWCMFLGEFWVLGVYGAQRLASGYRRRGLGKLERSPDPISPFVFILPATCDTMASGLSCVGMMLVPAPVFMMMKSSVVIFVAALSVFLLGKKLFAYHFLGLACTVAGLTTVGYASILDSEQQAAASGGSAWTTGLGVGLIIISQLAGALQNVFEEHLLQGKRISAKKVVGMEGFWGLIIQGALLVVFSYLPGSDNGHIEYLPDTIEMFKNSQAICMLMFLYVVGVGLCNICSLQVTKRISAVTRCLVGSSATMVVWVISLGLFYSGHEAYGTPWTPHSWIQLIGFFMLFLGTVLYNAILRVPGLLYPGGPAPASRSTWRRLSRLGLWGAIRSHRGSVAGPAWSPKSSGHGAMDDWDYSPPNSPVSSPNSPNSPYSSSAGSPGSATVVDLDGPPSDLRIALLPPGGGLGGQTMERLTTDDAGFVMVSGNGMERLTTVDL